MIEVTNVVKRYGSNTVLNNATFQIEEGQLTTILGPSGCGKSTMLRCMNRLEKFDRGRMKIAGVEVEGTEDRKLTAAEEKDLTRRLRKHVGIVFQNFNLFPHLTVLGNAIEAPVTVKGMQRKEAEEVARHYLDKVGLSAKEDFYPAQLSGGQQQRVAIARALAMEPDVILFDEPTSALDPQLIQEVARMFRALDDLGKTIVVVSHDMNFARRISDQVIYFEGGHAVEAGTPEEVFGRPQKEETRLFMRSFQDEDREATEEADASKGKIEEVADKGTRLSLGQEE
ncbi:MAG TPA: amino acid ABC transporter ATP-binding protein [Pyrinomonadaceae bacterium]|nr:amino acid ABC transporter ATP-binding protein [Pyrinomonadaceae bacterium]